jgi:carboxyl-terminal processing protease
MARSSRRSLFLVVCFLLACGFLGILFAQRTGQQSSLSSDTDVKDSLKQFTDVYAVIEENYAEPVNPDKAIYNGAIPGI